MSSTAAAIQRDRDYANNTAAYQAGQQAELDRQAQGRADYQATYGKKADRLANREDASLSSDMRMKENAQAINADKYRVDATTGAEVKVAGIGADTSRYVADSNLSGAKYNADMNFKGQQLASDTSRYGMDKTFDLGNRQLVETGRQFNVGMEDKQTERRWESGEKDKDRSLAGSLAGFQATLSLLGGSSTMGRGAAAPNNYWR